MAHPVKKRWLMFEVTAEPYDDMLPLVPFLVTRWKLRLDVLLTARRITVLRWHRPTRLGKYKHRHPGYYAGRNAWSPNEWGPV